MSAFLGRLKALFSRKQRTRTLYVLRAGSSHSTEANHKRVQDWLDGKTPCLVLNRDEDLEAIHVCDE